MTAAESPEEAETSRARADAGPSKPPRHRPLPPMTTAKRKPVGAPKMVLPPGFAPISSRIVLHSATGVAVELTKRRLADPATSYFIGRNNSVAIELYKTHRLPYYFITKGALHPANWVYMRDRKTVGELAQLATVVELKLCSECFLVCWENRERRHGCKDNTYFRCHGFAARADMTSLGHMIITDLPKLEGVQKESIDRLIEEQQMILENPTPEVKKEEDRWKESIKEEWKKVIHQRRDTAKEQYQEKKRRAEKIYPSGEDSEDDETTREQPQKALKLITKSNRAQHMLTSEPDTVPSLEELTASLESFITTIVSPTLPQQTPEITLIVNDYLTDPHISTTLLPYILLSTITDDLWSSMPSISNSFRFRLDAKNMKYLVNDEKASWHMSISLSNTGGENGWKTDVSLEGHPESRIMNQGLSFDTMCQVLVVFRAVIYTLLSSNSLLDASTMSLFITTAFESIPCEVEDSVRVIKEKMASHIAR